MNLGAGGSFAAPYTFSTPDLDLAIVSLDQRDAKFADELEERGYRAISSERISGSPTREGADVYTVGFPGATALVAHIRQDPQLAGWSSKSFSVPVSSFGRVAMLHTALPFYWVDMSIFPGNSGGPVIEGGRLVGVVSSQATTPLDSAPTHRVRIPFGKIVKAVHIAELLRRQEEKDRTLARIASGKLPFG